LWAPHNPFCSSSDSDYDDEEPHKFYVRIKPIQPRERTSSAVAVEQLKASVGSLILPPGLGVSGRGCPGTRAGSGDSAPEALPTSALFGPPLESAFENEDCTAARSYLLASSPSPFSSSSPENVEDSGLDSPSHLAAGPFLESRLWSPRPSTPQSPLGGQRPPKSTTGLRGSCSSLPPDKRDSCLSSNSASSSSSSPAPPSSGDSTSPSPWAPRGRDPDSGPPSVPDLSAEPGVSRGPSPVVLGSQGALPVAAAFTEYIHAYFKGQNPDSCLVKVTGELTMSFPAGIIRVFSSGPAPPVLSFRLLRTAFIEQFLPNADLLYSDASQSDPARKDFWLNMAALTTQLQKQAEQAVAAPYYNVTLLKYQYSKQGQAWAPLQLSVTWECSSDSTRVRVDYSYNAAALASAAALSNVQVLLPIEEPAANVQPQPEACWNLEEKRLLWRLLDVPGAQGSGCLLASWEPLNGPSKPSPVAAQFTSEGSTVSGADVELVGSGYRMSLVKKRFATGDGEAAQKRGPCMPQNTHSL
uniref:MHD domain-containing protein n=1 Tax=Varanus komodoensis TaxID=61221 RepID=A0A8D2LND8_VARKO